MNNDFEILFAKHIAEIKLIEQSLFGDDGRKDRPLMAFIKANDWGWYADAYRTAGNILIETVQRRKGYTDQLAYPIMALYRQSLELQLKRLHLLLFPACKLPITHCLDKLWKKLRSQWEQYPKPDCYSVRLTSLDKRLMEFHELDPTSQYSRYPTTTKGQMSFKRSTVNLRKMNEIANAIHKFIDQVATDIEEKRNGSEAG